MGSGRTDVDPTMTGDGGTDGGTGVAVGVEIAPSATIAVGE